MKCQIALLKRVNDVGEINRELKILSFQHVPVHFINFSVLLRDLNLLCSLSSRV